MSATEMGAYIKRMMKLRAINQSDLAEAIGISRQNLNPLLNGKIHEPKLSNIIAIGIALRVHPMVLIAEHFKGWDMPEQQQEGTLEPTDAIGFLRDVSYPDNSTISTSTTFVKTWEIQNIGKTTWRNRSLVCVDGEFDIYDSKTHVKKPSNHRLLNPTCRKIAIPLTEPKDIIQLSVEFTTPDYPCSVISYWKMVNQKGNLCFPENEGLSCLMRVVGY